VLHRPVSPAAAAAWVGFVLDEWSETIPSTSEDTGLTFHYDAPGAEAPQTVLIAVAPDPTEEIWDLATLTDILHETLDLAKMRAVDGELLGVLGQLLPAVYLAANPDEETIATDFTGMLIQEAQIFRGES